MKDFEAHILVVDDDKAIRELVKEYLDQNNFITTTAKDAADAKEKIKLIKFDLIILDIMMPGKSGLEFLKENKKLISYHHDWMIKAKGKDLYFTGKEELGPQMKFNFNG